MMVTAITPPRQNHATLLRSANVALHHGLGLAAGVMARVALESHLTMLCKSHQCAIEKKRPTARENLTRLYNRHHVTKATQRGLKMAITIGDKCAHNAPVSWADIQFTVNTARDFIETYPMAPWWEDMFPNEDC